MFCRETLLWALCLVAALLATACGGAPVEERRTWRGREASRTFQQPCDTVIVAGKKALEASDLELEAEEAFGGDGHAIYAEAGPFMLRQGEVVRIVFMAASPTSCKVSLRAEAKMDGNILKKSTGDYVSEYMLALRGHLATSAVQNKYQELEDDDEATPGAEP